MSVVSETATVSSRGQVVIPAALRKRAGLDKGDRVVFEYDSAENTIRICRAKDIDEIADRLTSYIKPGTAPLEDPSAAYAARGPRL